jgi:hypothetical protein
LWECNGVRRRGWEEGRRKVCSGCWEAGRECMHAHVYSLAYAASGKMETEVPEESFRDDVVVVGRQISCPLLRGGRHQQLLPQHNDK